MRGFVIAAWLLGVSACVADSAAPPPPIVPAAPAHSVLDELLAARPLDGTAEATDGPPGAAAPARATIVIVFASWCPHCHDEIALLGELRAAHPAMRVIGVNYRAHEEYDARGNAAAVRAYAQRAAPWMRVVPIGDDLFGELGSPPKIPTLYVYDARGALVEIFDRRFRLEPGAAELDAVLAKLGA